MVQFRHPAPEKYKEVIVNNNKINESVNLASRIIGLQKIKENREQSQHNDVEIANNKQAQFMLEKLYEKFDEQNLLLYKIITLLEKLIAED